MADNRYYLGKGLEGDGSKYFRDRVTCLKKINLELSVFGSFREKQPRIYLRFAKDCTYERYRDTNYDITVNA